MMENQILTTSFYDLKKALERNYYDIYYPQKYYRNPKKFIREYEAYNIYYCKHVVPKLSFPHERQSSVYLDMDTKLEKKWYHFVTCFFLSRKIVSIVSYDILHSRFQIQQESKKEFVLVLPENSRDKKLIHYYYYNTFSYIEPNFYIIVDGKNKLHVCHEIYTWDDIRPYLFEISEIKQNFIKYILNGLPPRFFPQFFDSNILHDHNKYIDGVSCGEISILYYCGKKIREKCHEIGIYTFHHEDFLDQLPNHTKNIVSRILSINQSKSSDNHWKFIDPSIRLDKNYEILLEKHKKNLIFYFDLEFTENHIYLSGFYDNDDNYNYIWNTCNKNFILEFIEFVKTHPNHAFVYYSAEIRKLKEFAKKTNLKFTDEFFINFIDLYELNYKYCAFRNCYDFKLKNIVKSFLLHGKIDKGYETTSCQNGLDSLEIFENYIIFGDEKEKDKLVAYNRLDCKYQKVIANEILLHENEL